MIDQYYHKLKLSNLELHLQRPEMNKTSFSISISRHNGFTKKLTEETWFRANICFTASVCLAKRLWSRQSFMDMVFQFDLTLLLQFFSRHSNVLELVMWIYWVDETSALHQKGIIWQITDLFWVSALKIETLGYRSKETYLAMTFVEQN